MKRISLALLGLLLCALGCAAFAKCDSPYKGTTFTRAKLQSLINDKRIKKPLNLCGTHLSGLDLSRMNLAGFDLSGADMHRTKLIHANLTGAMMHKTFLRWANLMHATLFQAKMSQAVLADADLVKSDLRQAILTHADLNHAQLMRAKLSGANLERANLSFANLNYAALRWTNLSSANLESANFTRTDMSHAKLAGAKLIKTNLTHANLSHADLERADLNGSRLHRADFTNANLNQAHYQPELGHLPNIIAFANSRNFRNMQFELGAGIAALAELRQAYSELRMRQMERQINAMLKVKDMHAAWEHGGWGYLEATLNYLLFYVTSDYGADPGGPLRIFLLFIILFMLPYSFALRYPTKKNLIEVIWPARHLLAKPSSDKKRILHKVLTYRSAATTAKAIKESFRLIRIAFFFSTLSAFQLGYSDLNVSNWIMRMQTRDYRLHGHGWVRVVSGAQAVLSAYLIVLWALTYFARPFEW